MAESAAISKYLYKIELIILKYTPFVIAILDIIHTICSYYDINASILYHLGGISILTMTFLYISSYVFKFCYIHRIPLHYILLSNTVAWYDAQFGIPVSDKLMFCIYLIIIGIFIVSYVYFYYKFKKKCCS